MKSPHSSKWHAAIEDELKSMKENKVWELEDVTPYFCAFQNLRNKVLNFQSPNKFCLNP